MKRASHLFFVALLLLLLPTLGGCEGVLGPIFGSDTGGSDDATSSTDASSDATSGNNDTGSGSMTSADTSSPPEDTSMGTQDTGVVDPNGIDPELTAAFDRRHDNCVQGCGQAFSCSDLWSSIEECEETCATIREINDELTLEDTYVDPYACVDARLDHQSCVQSLTDCDDYNEASYGRPGNLCEFEDDQVSTSCERR